MNIGDKMPEVLGVNQNEELITAASLKGKKVALYFYPKDSTPGCTKQACNIRDNYTLLQKEGYVIYGVSIDSVKSHKNFIAKQELPFDLIADTEKELVTKFGVWGEKSMYGKKYMGTFRTTFIFNEEGVLVRIINPKEVAVSNHTEQIIQSTI